MKFCESCGMPLTDEVRGTEANGSLSADYCHFCYKNGHFTQDMTMEQMIQFCLQFLDQMNASSGRNLTREQYEAEMRSYFPKLKRWSDDKRSIEEKAIALLAQCEEVTIASVDEQGCPRPVPMSKISTKSYNEVWLATGADSVKTIEFQKNPLAGLSYSHLGNSVALRGKVEVLTDQATREAQWQDWFIHHFPGGPSDPNYVVLHFVGSHATLWIDGQFERKDV